MAGIEAADGDILIMADSDDSYDWLSMGFFIEKIQPIASQINHYQYQLSPIFEIMTVHPKLSPSFKEYINNFDQNGFKNYQIAMQQHIQFWQGLFKQCNIKPGKR